MTELEQALSEAMKSIRSRSSDWPLYLRLDEWGHAVVTNEDGCPGGYGGFAGDSDEKNAKRREAVERLNYALRKLL
jgi:hypothetical protein